MSETIFPEGLIVKNPSPQAPDYVVAKLSIKADEFIAFIKANANNGWLNLEVLNGKSGKMYAKLDNYTKKEGESRPPAKRESAGRVTGRQTSTQNVEFDDEEIPF